MFTTRRYEATRPEPDLIILVHGAMDRMQSFGRAARRLSEYDCVTFDRRGYGSSLPLGAAAQPQQHVDDIFAIADGTNAAPEHTVLVGHSVGGLFALMAAAQRPERFRAIGAFEPPTPWKPWWPRPDSDPALDAPAAEIVEWFYRTVMGAHAWERLSDKARQGLTAEGPALSADLMTGRDEPMFDPDQIAVPVLIGVGEQTMPRYLRAADELTREIGTAELHVIAGASHGAHRSNADAFADFVRSSAGHSRS